LIDGPQFHRLLGWMKRTVQIRKSEHENENKKLQTGLNNPKPKTF
jgi:hypothetical protein